MHEEQARGMRRAVAALLCALCVTASQPAFSAPAAPPGPSAGDPKTSSVDVHHRLATWTFPSPEGYSLDRAIVTEAGLELAFNGTTGTRVSPGKVTTRDFLPQNLTSWDSLGYDADLPRGCRLAFYISTDSGAIWNALPPNGSLEAANESSGMLRLRSELWSAEAAATPLLRSILVSYTVNSIPQIISLSCRKSSPLYAHEPAVINSRVADPDGDPLSYLWNQTEGLDALLGPVDKNSLTFTPLDPGPIAFRLSVSDGFGAQLSASINLEAVKHPIAISFKVEGSLLKSSTVHIIANVSNPGGLAIKYEWKLVSAPPFTTLVQPTKPDILVHVFFAGACTVSLTVTDDEGTTAKENITFEIIGRPPCASLTADRDDGHAGQVYRFDASASTDADGDRLQYRFEFGDGQSTDWVDFSKIDHIYERAGFFTARVRARDIDGLFSDAQYTVHVKPPNHPPAAAFLVTPGNLTAPFMFASTSKDQDGSIVYQEWSFGDGTTATGPTVSHRYALPGRYTVRLWVSDDDGQTSSATSLVSINHPPELVSRTPPGDIAVTPDGAVYLSVEAVDPDGDALSYSWYVNGEYLPGETTKAHHFESGRDGRYDITVKVNDGRGGRTNHTWNLTILPEPAPAPMPDYSVLAVIVAALAAQAAGLSAVALRSRSRRKKNRSEAEGAAPGASPATGPVPTLRPVPPESPETPPLASRTSILPGLPPPEHSPPPIPPPEIPPPDAMPPETLPPEAWPLMEELSDPEPLARALQRADRKHPYLRRPPPF